MKSFQRYDSDMRMNLHWLLFYHCKNHGKGIPHCMVVTDLWVDGDKIVAIITSNPRGVEKTIDWFTDHKCYSSHDFINCCTPAFSYHMVNFYKFKYDFPVEFKEELQSISRKNAWHQSHVSRRTKQLADFVLHNKPIESSIPHLNCLLSWEPFNKITFHDHYNLNLYKNVKKIE